jgi:hypothetical protein
LIFFVLLCFAENEFACDKRKENVHELLSSLLDQLHSGSAADARTFEKSYDACSSDLGAQQQSVNKAAKELGRLSQLLRILRDQLPESEKEAHRIEIAQNATQGN